MQFTQHAGLKLVEVCWGGVIGWLYGETCEISAGWGGETGVRAVAYLMGIGFFSSKPKCIYSLFMLRELKIYSSKV